MKSGLEMKLTHYSNLAGRNKVFFLFGWIRGEGGISELSIGNYSSVVYLGVEVKSRESDFLNIRSCELDFPQPLV